MKLLYLRLIFLTAIIVPMRCTTPCDEHCDCDSDRTCKYYCDNRKCRKEISRGSRCQGYDIHPQECGPISFCDPDSNGTCQYTKYNGQQCKNNWSCGSKYCDSSLKTCQDKTDWSLPNLIPSIPNLSSYTLIPAIIGSIIGFIVILVTIIFIIRARNRRLIGVSVTSPIWYFDNSIFACGEFWHAIFQSAKS